MIIGHKNYYSLKQMVQLTKAMIIASAMVFI